MADDDRYSWLDDDAVEQLLRGEPVEVAITRGARDERSAAEAARLSAALRAVADVAHRPADPTADGVLPGEEAAVAAFRSARGGLRRSGAAGLRWSGAAESAGAAAPRGVRGAWASWRGAGRAVSVATSSVPSVSSASGRTAPGGTAPGGTASGTSARGGRSAARWGGGLRVRPLRFCMAATLAGCAALGGVAFAVGSGALPNPFGAHDGSPAPRTSMSATGDQQPAVPEMSEDVASPGATDLDEDDNDASGGSGRSAHPGPSSSGTYGPARVPSGQSQKMAKGWVRSACQQYLAADQGSGPELDPMSRQKLEKAAGGSDAVHGYCSQLLVHDTRSAGGSPSPSQSDGGSRPPGSGRSGPSDPASPGGGDSTGPTPTTSPTPSPSETTATGQSRRTGSAPDASSGSGAAGSATTGDSGSPGS